MFKKFSTILLVLLLSLIIFNQKSFAKADIKPDPDIVVFDITQVGDESDSKVVKIYNRGSSKAYVIDVKILGDDRDDFDIVDEDCKLEDLKKDEYCSIEVVFKPESKGTKSALLSVLTTSGTEEIPLVGIGTTGAALSVDPVKHDFGKVDIGDSKSVIVTLENKGNERIEVTKMKLEVDDDNFKLDEEGGYNPCGTTTPTLEPDESCTIKIIYEPDTESFRFTVLKIKYDTESDEDLYSGGVYYGEGNDNGGGDDGIDIGCSYGTPALPIYLLIPIILYLRRIFRK